MLTYEHNTGAKNEWRIEGVTVPGGEGDPVGNGDGSEAKPYAASQVVAMGKSVNETGKWVSGYIVGYIPDKYLDGALFAVPATSATNILLADTPTETDYNKCVPVQLPSGSLRSALNLMDNPSNLGQLCSVYGDLTAYFGAAGVKNTADYKLDGASTPPLPPPAIPSPRSTKHSTALLHSPQPKVSPSPKLRATHRGLSARLMLTTRPTAPK